MTEISLIVTLNSQFNINSTSKKETTDSEYKERFLQLKDSYESKNFTCIYTDGSKSENHVSSSAVCSTDILKANLPEYSSIFSAEAVALKLAVQYIQRQVIRKNSNISRFTVMSSVATI